MTYSHESSESTFSRKFDHLVDILDIDQQNKTIVKSLMTLFLGMFGRKILLLLSQNFKPQSAKCKNCDFLLCGVKMIYIIGFAF